MIVCPIGLAEGVDCNSFMLVGSYTEHVDRNGRQTEAQFTTGDAEEPITCNAHDCDVFIMGEDPHVFDLGPAVEASGPIKQYQFVDGDPEDIRWQMEQKEFLRGLERMRQTPVT